MDCPIHFSRSPCLKVHIYWEGNKILRNLHCRFVWCSASEIYGGDFENFYGLHRIHELYQMTSFSGKKTVTWRWSFRKILWPFQNIRTLIPELQLIEKVSWKTKVFLQVYVFVHRNSSFVFTASSFLKLSRDWYNKEFWVSIS